MRRAVIIPDHRSPQAAGGFFQNPCLPQQSCAARSRRIIANPSDQLAMSINPFPLAPPSRHRHSVTLN